MKNLRLMAFVAVMCAFLNGCEKPMKQKACDPIPVIDGFRAVKVKDGNWTLKLPSYVNINQSYYENKAEECQYIRDFIVDFVWYEGKLLSHTIYADKLPLGAAGHIEVMGGATNVLSQDYTKNFDSEKVKYKYEQDFEHQRFPLAHLPKYEWDDPMNPSKLSLDMSNPPDRWAIIGTKYGTPKMHYPFHTFCDFDYVGGKYSKEGVIAVGLTKNGDAKCRGQILTEKNNKYIGGMVDVWANLGGKDQSNIKDINKIYDAIVEELNSYIQE